MSIKAKSISFESRELARPVVLDIIFLQKVVNFAAFEIKKSTSSRVSLNIGKLKLQQMTSRRAGQISVFHKDLLYKQISSTISPNSRDTNITSVSHSPHKLRNIFTHRVVYRYT